METTRRRARALLSRLDASLLDEFIRMDVGLTKLLASIDSGHSAVTGTDLVRDILT